MEACVRKFPLILAGLFALLWGVLAIEPAFRDVWWAENIPVMFVFGLLVVTYPRFQFSNTAYILMACWLVLHTIGGHYTFSNVPFDFVSEFFGFERNHFDRMGHFTVGFYAFPAAELMTRNRSAARWVVYCCSLFFIMAVAAGYEIIEWWYAVAEGGDAGIAVLGSQGDIWDAQKDMLSDTLGAITALLLFAVVGKRNTYGKSI